MSTVHNAIAYVTITLTDEQKELVKKAIQTQIDKEKPFGTALVDISFPSSLVIDIDVTLTIRESLLLGEGDN